MGTIDNVSKDDDATFFHVSYEDFDEEELDLGEVLDHVSYHPELDVSQRGLEANPFPPEGSWILYASDYQPRIGKVLEIHPDLTRSVVVQVWKPKQPRRGTPDLASARYKTYDSADNPDRQSISPAQIRIDNLQFGDDDRLDDKSRSLVQGILKKWKLRSRRV